LIEETGWRAQVEEVGVFYPSPGYVGEKMTIWRRTSPRVKPNQWRMKDRMRWFSPAEVNAVEVRKIIDGKL
jgi:hypothetical protein